MQTDRPPLAPCSPIPNVKDELLKAVPKLRAFAVSLCGRTGGRIERADDLVQETLVKALANINSFTPGSNMPAWLYTILRNEFYSAFRKRRHEVQDEDGAHAAKMESRPEQEGHLHFLELQDALGQLRPEQREALVLIGASGLSYEDAAGLCACAIGTMKSRVNRARASLAALLAVPEQYPESKVVWLRTEASANGRTHTPRIAPYSAAAGKTATTRHPSFAATG
jgi:RNA polymerase sigma-70 factor (ECF subfamily)